jgi:hypothetical protein
MRYRGPSTAGIPNLITVELMVAWKNSSAFYKFDVSKVWLINPTPPPPPAE